jgi:serine/threonine-protein kinase ATR
MQSLQKPKKITVYASDGRSYIFLCKPKDDLRKDSRLMEFNSVINRLCNQDSVSRKRHLYIRTYAVVPLNEECGMIEWVNNTVGFRNILNRIYRIHKITSSGALLQQFMAKKDPKDKKDFFVQVLLKQ